MKKFTSGLIAGGIIGVIGLGYAISDRNTRKRLKRDTRKAAHRANNMLDNISDMF